MALMRGARAVAGTCAFALSLAASANPENGQVVGGAGSISQSGALTQVNQSSAALAINWDSFNVGAAEIVQFVQPGTSAVALNRITGGGASEIFGRIDANGSVFLVNTAGVVFAEGSQINVANLVVSGLDMTVEDFMAGNYELAANGLPGAVINHGTIAAASGGSVVLVGGQVVNTGLIRANYGRVTLAGAEAGYVDFDGNGLLRFEVTGELQQKLEGADAAVTNSGTTLWHECSKPCVNSCRRSSWIRSPQ
jgi:filamentous hemagglutinin family protein